MSKITVWQATDRQGTKWFKKRPDFVAGHDIFTGERFTDDVDNGALRVIRRFTARVQGRFPGYPSTIKVAP